jgi:malate dehydrogenase (oxaloacetate-decarboxylating)(NADP+)
MQPVFDAAVKAPKRVAYAEGEDERVLRAAQVVVDERLARPLLVGRAEVIAERIERFGLRIRAGADVDVVDPATDARLSDAWQDYWSIAKRKGVSRAMAMDEVRQRPTLAAALLVRHGHADALLCGTLGPYGDHLKYVRNVIGTRAGVSTLAALQMVILPQRQLFICDTHVNRDPDAQQVAEMTLLAADEVRRFGLKPVVALLSHSSFGSSDAPSARKMREAVELVAARAPGLAVEGEMRGDAALSKPILDTEFPGSRLPGEANLLVMPNVDAANITYNVLRMTAGEGITVGGMLLGVAKPAHILTPSATVRRIVNMSAVAVVDAGAPREAT